MGSSLQRSRKTEQRARNTMNPEEFKRFHELCVKALERYLVEATKMCEMLGHSQVDPLGLMERSEINAQRLRENDAHARYHELRAQLLEAAQAGYGSLN